MIATVVSSTRLLRSFFSSSLRPVLLSHGGFAGHKSTTMASRRQTMQANDSGGPGAFSRLPMATPSTSKPMSQYQAQQNFRASLAPGSMPPPVFNPRQSMAGGMGGPLRASTLGGGPIPPGSVPRQSMYRAPTNPLMQSAMKTPMGK
jgi:hypothetical protein